MSTVATRIDRFIGGAFAGWSTPPGERAPALLRIAYAQEERGEELSQVESLNAGSPIAAMLERSRRSSTTCASSRAPRAACDGKARPRHREGR